jgi:CRISPR-associated protein Cas2
MADDTHVYLVAYDIADTKRWRRVFNVMNGYGEWLQLSVFQCRLSKKQHAELIALLDGIIHHGSDHVVLLDVGPAKMADLRIVSLGKSFETVQRVPVIV